MLSNKLGAYRRAEAHFRNRLKFFEDGDVSSSYSERKAGLLVVRAFDVRGYQDFQLARGFLTRLLIRSSILNCR